MEDETKQIVFKLLPYSFAISIIISLIAAYVYSRVITRPIKNILRVTKDMEKLKTDSYCVVESEDEIGIFARLAGTEINPSYGDDSESWFLEVKPRLGQQLRIKKELV